jgi:hypothetical protein
MPELRQILAELLAHSANTEQPQKATLPRGLRLKTRVFNHRREVLLFRNPGGASHIEARVIRNALEFHTKDPEPFSSQDKSINGWKITELLPDELETLQSNAKANYDALSHSRRADDAAQIKLELYPQHPDSQAAYLELWRDGFMQLQPNELEAKILELQTNLANRQKLSTTRGQHGKKQAQAQAKLQ